MKNKKLTLSICLVIVLAGIGGVIFFLLQTRKISINNPFLAPYIEPSPEEKQYVDLSKHLVDWVLPFKVADTPYANVQRCDTKGENCTPQTVVHRDNIANLWGRSELYKKTNAIDQLHYITEEVDALAKYMSQQDDGRDRVWQVDYYHCVLIDQILEIKALPDKTKAQLASFCSESINEASVVTPAVELQRKIENLHNPQVAYDWKNDSSVLMLQSWELADIELINNVLLLAEQVVKGQYPAQTDINPDFHTLDEYLDTALSSYYLLFATRFPTISEQYQIDLSLIYGLQMYLQYHPDTTYPLEALKTALTESLIVPTLEWEKEVVNPLYQTQILYPIVNICYLEMNVDKPTSIYQQTIETLLSYHHSQERRLKTTDFLPYYVYFANRNDNPNYIQFPLQFNGLAAGCLAMNNP